MISPASISRIRSAVHLPTLVEEYVPLRKMGPRYVGRCPFHKEDTASFGVHPHYFKCFGCGAGGDCYTFLKEIANLSFSDAARWLSTWTGIPLDSQPVSRRQMQYAKEQADFCKWWWVRRRTVLKRILDWAMDEEPLDEEFCEFIGTRWRWKPTPLEAFEYFRDCATEGDREEWRRSSRADGAWLRLIVDLIGGACDRGKTAQGRSPDEDTEQREPATGGVGAY